MRVRRIARVALGLIVTLAISARAEAQGKTDVVTLANGDRITGEVKALDRGRLEFSTDDAGTLYLEWDKLVSVVAARMVEVVTGDGRRAIGSLGRADDRSIAVAGADGSVVVFSMLEVTNIWPIGASFWRKLDGSMDAGFSYTRSSGVAQLTFNSDTAFRRPGSEVHLSGSLTVTQTDDDSGRDDRGSINALYQRYRWREWFVAAATRFETNESLGLKLRSQAGLATGPRLVNSNRAQLLLGGGLVFNDERGIDVEPTQNVEGLLTMQTSYFTYDRPKTNLDVTLMYYPSLSNVGRHRLQLDASVRREVLKDLFLAVNGYNSYDSRPPNPDANTNDVGITLSIGWSY